MIFQTIVCFLFLSSTAFANESFLQIPDSTEHLKVLNISSSYLDYRNLQILVWNVQKLPSSQTFSDFQKLLNQSNLSLIQESYLTPAFYQVANMFSHQHVEMAQSFFDIHGISTGVSTWARGKPGLSYALQSKFREPIISTPKMILIQTFYHPEIKSPLLVLNIHALNFVSQTDFEAQILQSMKFIRNHKGPIIYAGDFNTWNKERQIFLDKLFTIYSLQRIPLSSPAFLKLDHIYTRGFRVLKAQVIENIASSDHYPISAELSLVTQ